MSTAASKFEPLPGLQYRDIKQCTGPAVTEGSRVTLLYKVALSEHQLETGDCIESSFAPDIPIDVIATSEELLPGVYWTLLGMRAGGSVRRVAIAPELAFGARGSRDKSVPPGSTVWVELCVSQVAESDAEQPNRPSKR